MKQEMCPPPDNIPDYSMVIFCGEQGVVRTELPGRHTAAPASSYIPSRSGGFQQCSLHVPFSSLWAGLEKVAGWMLWGVRCEAKKISHPLRWIFKMLCSKLMNYLLIFFPTFMIFLDFIDVGVYTEVVLETGKNLYFHYYLKKVCHFTCWVSF